MARQTTSNPIRSILISAAIAAAGLGGAASLITESEGYSPATYVDPLGIPTICRGATDKALVAKGRATIEECDKQTWKDIQVAEATVKRCAPVTMTQGELNAWTSFAYNVGPGGKRRKDGFCMLRSGAKPKFLKLLLQQPATLAVRKAACYQLFSWTQPGTSVHNGLMNRRTKEYAMCITDLNRLEGNL